MAKRRISKPLYIRDVKVGGDAPITVQSMTKTDTRDVRATVRNIASGLRSIGIGLGDNVAVLSTNSPRWAMADYGVICNGSATVTVYPTLLPAQIEYILNNSDSKAVFVENQDQLDKINFPESLEGIHEFYKVCDDYIENGYSLHGKIKLVGFKRILKYMFGCNKGSPVDAMLEYNENV